MTRLAFLAALAALASPAAAALQFTVPAEDASARVARAILEGGQVTVYASGEIERGDAARLAQFIAANDIRNAKVAFNSPGGALGEALQIGSTIRARGFDTTVKSLGGAAVCASSCAYAFAGGVNRYFDQGSGRLGIHQFYAPGQSQADIGEVQAVSGLLVAYLDEMGADASAFAVATTAGSSQMVWLSPSDAEALGLANNGAEPTTAEIKTMEMTPYLRIEQKRARGQARVLVMCEDRKPTMLAGVVASPEEAAFHASMSKRSYVELDGEEALVEAAGGAAAQDSVLWLDRKIDPPTARKLLRTKLLDIWTEGGGGLRWGGSVDLRPVRQKLASYLSDCAAS
jgi:hypothetical protein